MGSRGLRGLAIVQRIVSRHGVRCGPDLGSTFGFSLPLHELTASDPQISTSAGDEVVQRRDDR